MGSIGQLPTGKLPISFTNIRLKYSDRPTFLQVILMDGTMAHRPKTCTCPYEITITYLCRTWSPKSMPTRSILWIEKHTAHSVPCNDQPGLGLGLWWALGLVVIVGRCMVLDVWYIGVTVQTSSATRDLTPIQHTSFYWISNKSGVAELCPVLPSSCGFSGFFPTRFFTVVKTTTCG